VQFDGTVNEYVGLAVGVVELYTPELTEMPSQSRLPWIPLPQMGNGGPSERYSLGSVNVILPIPCATSFAPRVQSILRSVRKSSCVDTISAVCASEKRRDRRGGYSRTPYSDFRYLSHETTLRFGSKI